MRPLSSTATCTFHTAPALSSSRRLRWHRTCMEGCRGHELGFPFPNSPLRWSHEPCLTRVRVMVLVIQPPRGLVAYHVGGAT